MANMHDHAMMLLHYMLDKGLVASKGISPRELRAAVGLNDNDYRSAENFLLQDHLLEGGGGGPDGIRWLTSRGVKYINEEMKQRMPIDFDAEMVLRFLISNIKDNEFLTQDEILEGVNISPEQYDQACQQLADFDFVTIFGEDALIPTKQGRQAVHRNFQKAVSAPSIQAGAIFNGPVTGGNIQAIANAIDSQIQQNVSSLSPEELQKELEQTLQKLVDQVIEHLSLEQKAIYTQMAAEFQKETTQAKPDPGKLQKLLAGLGLLSEIGGTIDLGQKTFELVVKASPYIMMLGQMIVQLLKNLPH